MKLCKRVIRICVVVYFILLIIVKLSDWYTEYDSYSKEYIAEKSLELQLDSFRGPVDEKILNYKFQYVIGIWGDANIAKYLWLDIFGAKNDLIHNEEGISFRIISASNADVRYDVLLLVGNGRSKLNILRLRILLQYLLGRNAENFGHNFLIKLRSGILDGSTQLGLFMIGHEFCKNSWLEHYLKELSVIFITYNAVEISEFPDKVYRWPLGVASYRHFPPISTVNINLKFGRTYFCNFMGTVYQNSSRAVLVEELNELSSHKGPLCFVTQRNNWPKHETNVSAFHYQSILKKSDFTLCPVGVNEETYRIYEALSMASIPIIEDNPPLFVTQDFATLVNHCHSNKSDNSLIHVNMNQAIINTTSFHEDDRHAYDDFLTEDGSYCFDEPSGRILACSNNNIQSNGHRFLKEYKAPVLFAKTISGKLIATLKKNLSQKKIVLWRALVFTWYRNFRIRIKETMFDIMKSIINHKP